MCNFWFRLYDHTWFTSCPVSLLESACASAVSFFRSSRVSTLVASGQKWLCAFCVSVQPNIYLSMGDDSAQHRKWYYEVVVERAEPFVTPEPTHLRVGWACSAGSHPSLTGGHGWGSNGVGDDLRSYGFDGLHLWTGERTLKNKNHLLALLQMQYTPDNVEKKC